MGWQVTAFQYSPLLATQDIATLVMTKVSAALGISVGQY